jgi:hypothetical protein
VSSVGRAVNLLQHVATTVLFLLLGPGWAAAAICIDVDVRFKGDAPPPALVASMQREASSIWEPHGVYFRWWTSFSRCDKGESFEVLVDQEVPRRPWSSPATLGSTRMTRGITFMTLDPMGPVTIHIDRGATERLLGSLTVEQLVRTLGRAAPRPADVGRALGRVFAHEAGHVILAEREHQPHGLMRPTFLAEDLVGPGRKAYSLSPAEVARVRDRELAITGSSGEAQAVCCVCGPRGAAKKPAAQPDPHAVRRNTQFRRHDDLGSRTDAWAF